MQGQLASVALFCGTDRHEKVTVMALLNVTVGNPVVTVSAMTPIHINISIAIMNQCGTLVPLLALNT